MLRATSFPTEACCSTADSYLSPEPRVQGVPDSVTEKIEPQSDEKNRQSGKEDEPGGYEYILDPSVREVPKLREKWGWGETDEHQGREDEYHASHVERRLNEDRVDRVRDDMPEQNPEPPSPGGAECLDVGLLFFREHLGTDKPHVGGPPDNEDGGGQPEEAVREKCHQDYGQRKPGDGEEDIGYAEHRLIQKAPGIRRHRPHADPDGHGRGHNCQGYLQVQGERQDNHPKKVSSVGVGSERVDVCPRTDEQVVVPPIRDRVVPAKPEGEVLSVPRRGIYYQPRDQ